MQSNLLMVLVFTPMAGAIISYLIGRKNKTARDFFADFVVAAEFLGALYLCVTFSPAQRISCELSGFAGFGLHFVMDGFRSVYVLVAAVMWLMTTIFSREYFKHYRNRNRYYLFLLLTFGATMGVFLSADLYTTFIFFEMMSFTSYVWVCHDEKETSMRAGQTYLAVAVIGGMVMLMGLFLLYHCLGTLAIDELPALAASCGNKDLLYGAAICISVGFAAKAGAFPLHIWLPKAHPVAPAPASALLSGILTKAGIFGLLVISCNLLFGDSVWGSGMLLIGTITMFLGALLALFSVDLKRTLACSSVSQIGFILVGIGMQGLLGNENTLAARGTLLHMMNHSLIKLVLFMAAGVVFMNTHKLNLNDIRGFGRKKPLLHVIFLAGALGIGGVPLFNGYVSKTLLHEGIVEYTYLLSERAADMILFSVADMKTIEWIFLISGGITVAYMTKLYVAVFVEKNTDRSLQDQYDDNRHYMNTESALALFLAAVLLPVMGFLPGSVMDGIADRGVSLMRAGAPAERISYFSLSNLKGAGISIVIGAALYIVVVRLCLMKKKKGHRVYVNRWHRFLDLENSFYRPLICALCAVSRFFCRILDSFADAIVVLLRKTVYKDRPYPTELAEGTQLTYSVGSFLNMLEEWMERHNPRWNRKHHDYVHELALFYVEWTENKMIITRTLSFGLLMFCFGLVLTVVYMLRIYW